MRKLIVLTTLIFSLAMFSSTCFAEWKWKKVGVNSGHTYYLNLDSIRIKDGHVYWFDLTDYPKPNKFGDASVLVYHQGDCKLFRYKDLMLTFFKKPMGQGISQPYDPPKPKWDDPNPDSIVATILKEVCEYAN